VLADAVGDFNRSMIAPQTRDSVRGGESLPWPTTREMRSPRWWD
jgi:hypothetical protein